MEDLCKEVERQHDVLANRIEPYFMFVVAISSSIVVLRFAFLGINHVHLHR